MAGIKSMDLQIASWENSQCTLLVLGIWISDEKGKDGSISASKKEYKTFFFGGGGGWLLIWLANVVVVRIGDRY